MDIELEQKLEETGNLLLNPPSSIDELLPLLDEMEHLLMKVDQMPPRSTEDALLLPMKALISSALLKHSNEDAKCLVASCICEIARITAPTVPYNDDQMREIFVLIVTATEKVSQISGRFYMNAVSILHILSTTRLCLVMLDLELAELVIKMFRHFLRIIRPDHPQSVFSAMTSIMTMVINESEEISLDLLNVLLGSLSRENQEVPPIALKLAEKVIAYSAAKLKPYLQKAVQSAGKPVDLYAPVVAFICQDECCGIGVDHINGAHLANGSSEDATSPVDGICILGSSNGAPSTENADDAVHGNCLKLPEPCSFTQLSEKEDVEGIAEAVIKRGMEANTRKKRGWKPNFLMNPDEGYDHSWTCNGRKAAKLLRKEKQHDKERDDSPSENPVVKSGPLPTTQEGMREMKDLSPKSGEILNACSPSVDRRLGNAKKCRPRRHTNGSLKSLSSGKLASSQLEGASTPNSGGDLRTSSTSPTQRQSNGGPAKKGWPRKEKYTNSLSLSSGKISSPISEEGTMASDDDSLRKQTKRRDNIKFMKEKHVVIVGLASKAVKKKSLALLEVKNEVLSEDEETVVPQAVKVGMQKVNRSGSSVRRRKKKNAVDGSSDGNATLASGCKENIISDQVGNSQEKTPKSNIKRMHTPRKEVDSEHPNLGEELIGSRIKVWWPLDKTFYEGVVDSYDTSKKKHKILYTDGDEEILNLRKQRWELVSHGTSPGKDHDSSLPKTNASNYILPKQKGRSKPQSCKKRNNRSSTKSNDSENYKIKSEPSDIDESAAVNDLRNDSKKTCGDSKHDSKEADNGNKPAIKLKIKGPKTVTPSEEGQSQGQKFKIIFPKAITPPGVEKTEMPKWYL